jgi:hypothetical protein
MPRKEKELRTYCVRGNRVVANMEKQKLYILLAIEKAEELSPRQVERILDSSGLAAGRGLPEALAELVKDGLLDQKLSSAGIVYLLAEGGRAAECAGELGELAKDRIILQVSVNVNDADTARRIARDWAQNACQTYDAVWERIAGEMPKPDFAQTI